MQMHLMVNKQKVNMDIHAEGALFFLFFFYCIYLFKTTQVVAMKQFIALCSDRIATLSCDLAS